MPDTSTTSSDADADSAAGDTDTTPRDGTQQRSTDTGGGDDWKSVAAQAQADAAKWKELARKHEGRARENADAATRAKTVEEQLAELHKAMADRDIADVTRAGRLALAQVHAQIAEVGLSRDDVAPLLDGYDTTRLLTDGEPDDKAIGRLAASLRKFAGRTTPDRDQGRRGGDQPADMNTLIRRAAGVIT